MHGEEYGSQLEIIWAIWEIWKNIVDQSRGKPSYMYDPFMTFKDFHSWQEVIDWAYEDEEKTKASQKIKNGSKQKKGTGAAALDSKDKKSNTALIAAAYNGNIEEVKKLIDKGADIEAKDNVGWTALLGAALKGHTENVELLIDKGADIEAKDNDGFTALLGAALKGHMETVELLLDKGADIEAKENNGWTALLGAASQGDTKTVELLLDKGADTEAKDNDGWTALMYAAMKGHTETVKLLLDKGADIEAQDSDGKTALSVAEEAGHEEIIKLLKKYAAGQNSKNSSTKRNVAEQKIEKKEDREGEPRGKRITYNSWEEFEKEQSAKDQQKKIFMPIARNVHELIISTFKENKMPYEVRYGDGTFSFSVPQDVAKTKTRTCVRFGLLNFNKDNCYLESLYKDAADDLPQGAKLRKKDDPTGYFYNFASIDDYEKVKKDIKKGVLKSYQILAK